MSPRIGDVLVSNPTATLVHEVIIVGTATVFDCAHHADAVAKAQELAAQYGVDAWLTGDHTHFLKIASRGEATVDPAHC